MKFKNYPYLYIRKEQTLLTTNNNIMPIEHNMWSGMPGDTWEDHQKREQEMIEQAEREAKERVAKWVKEIEEKERKEKEENED